MATVRALTSLRSLAQSPLPLWSVALLSGQVWGGLGVPLASPLAQAVACGAWLALLARRPRAAVAAVLLLVGHAQTEGMLLPPGDASHVAALAPGRARLRARVVEVDELESGKLRLLLDADSARAHGWRPASGLVQLSVAQARRAWRKGMRIEVEVPLRRPRNFGNPGEFDYAGFLARRCIYVSGFLLDDASLGVLEEPPPGWIDAWRERVRAQLAALTSPAGEILVALILGEMGPLSRPLRQQFAAAGVSHVLSISGLHVAMVAGSAYALVRWLLSRSRWLLLRTRVPLLAAALSLGPVWLYAELAQAGVATWRAVAMLGLVVFALLLGRKADLPVSLAAAAIGVSVAWPGIVLDLSFQLSFVSVLALVLAMERYWLWWRRYEEARLFRLRHGLYRWLGWGIASMVVNLSALVATAPLTAYHFNQVPLIAVVANPLVVPLLGTLAVAIGLVGAVAVLVPGSLAAWIFCAAGLVSQAGAWLTARLAELPGAGVRVVTPSLCEVSLVYAMLLGAVLLRQRARRRFLLVVALIALVDAGWQLRQRYFRPALRVTFLSVGQGDSTVVEFPGSGVMVVDGGGLRSFDTGERIVARYLWSRKIAHVDLLVLTHPDYDHYGGLESLTRLFAPSEFWRTAAPSQAPSHARLLAAVADGATREVVASAGERRDIGGCGVEVVWPLPRLERMATNDTSLVLRIECGSFEMLLPGDLQAAGEAKLVSSGARLGADLLKVGHHGSRTSSTPAFLDAVRPRAAVISAGYGNRFHFPDAGVLRQFAARAVDVFRTDLDGAVVATASLDGGVVIETSDDAARAHDAPAPVGRMRSTVVDSPGSGDYRPPE